MPDSQELLQRVTARPDVFGGKPIIRDMRIAVEHILGMLAAGETVETILQEYPELGPEDLRACFAYAYSVVAGESTQAVRLRTISQGRLDEMSASPEIDPKERESRPGERP